MAVDDEKDATGGEARQPAAYWWIKALIGVLVATLAVVQAVTEQEIPLVVYALLGSLALGPEAAGALRKASGG